MTVSEYVLDKSSSQPSSDGNHSIAALDGGRWVRAGFDAAAEARQNRILPLALLTLTDPSSVEVLGDAVQEADWYDERVLMLMKRTSGSPEPRQGAHRKRRRKQWKKLVASPTPLWALAVASVLLFGGWSTQFWATPLRVRLVEEGWYVDPVHGNDQSQGDSPSRSLRSHAELARRLSISDTRRTGTTIHLMGELPVADRNEP